jgi:hypothetical protein
MHIITHVRDKIIYYNLCIPTCVILNSGNYSARVRKAIVTIDCIFKMEARRNKLSRSCKNGSKVGFSLCKKNFAIETFCLISFDL